MGTYKVIQDIEADDKLLGPLSMRQFLYAVIVAVSLFIGFRLALVSPLLAIPLLPHTIVFGFLAAPFGKDQPNEVWLAAKIRFFIKPRRRIWDQSGAKELVTITAPKKLQKSFSDGLSQTQVRSRLEALANTLDSRGWAVKSTMVNLTSQPFPQGQTSGSDRLVDPSLFPQEVSNIDVGAVDDIFDNQNNPKAQQLTAMIDRSAQAHRQKVVADLQNNNGDNQQTPATKPTTIGQPANNNQPPADYWFLNQQQTSGAPSGYSAFNSSQVVAPHEDSGSIPSGPANAQERELLNKLHAEQGRPQPTTSHLKKLKPLSEQRAEAAKKAAEASTISTSQTSPKQVDPAILNLARSNDLNVDTLSRQANKQKKNDLPDDEVVVSLH